MADNLKYFRITAVEDTKIRLETVGSPSSMELEYKKSTDSAWSSFQVDTDYTILTDEWIELRGQNSDFSHTAYDYYRFTSTGQIDVSGELYSLIEYNAQTADQSEYTGCFSRLFRDCKVRNAKDLALPYKQTSAYAYAYMFENCQNLISLPQIDGYGYAHYGYAYMFYGVNAYGLTLVINRTDMQDQDEMFVQFVSEFGGQGGTVLITNQNVDIPTSVIPDNWYRQYVDDSQHDYLTLSNIVDASFTKIHCNYEDNLPQTLHFWARPETSQGLMPWRRVFPGRQLITNSENSDGITKIQLKGECLCAPDDNGVDRNSLVLEWSNSNVTMETYSRIVSGKLTEFVDWRNPLSYDNINLLASSCNYRAFLTNNYSLEDCSGLVLPAIVQQYSPDEMFDSMFSSCTSLTKAPELPATTLVNNCYTSMFSGCTSLTQAPELPATTLADYCYEFMFNNCTSLTQAPELPATVLPIRCYRNMFNGCSSLTKAPALPATSLNLYCYAEMFQNCTSLTQAPELPATQLYGECYRNMFNGCSSLTKAPALPATSLANLCYFNMFYGCTALTEAPELPATTLATYCYRNMFNGCSSLTKAPELPATTLADYCYQNMFNGCTALTKAPILPASLLAQYCYAYMFQNCTALTEAPDMYATNLVNYCCQHMFNGCTNLNHIIWRSKTVPSVSFCNSWLVNASTSGTFEYTQPFLDVASIERNVSGVPAGWNIQQLKPQAGGISLKINNIDVNKFMLLGKNISSLSINGVKVKSSTPIGTDIELPSHLTKLLYVDSNGGTIDTGVPTNGNLKVGIKWSKTKTGNSTWPEMFGNKSIAGFNGDYYKAFALILNSNGAGTQFGAHYDFFHGLYSPTERNYGGRVDIMESDPSLSDTVNEFWLSPTEFSWNGQVFNTVEYANLHGIREHNDWEYQPDRLDKSNMFLFTSKTGNREAIVNCYNFYIVDTSTNTVLVNYVPCKYGTQAGFYDTVSQTFVTNSKFLAGPEA